MACAEMDEAAVGEGKDEGGLSYKIRRRMSSAVACVRGLLRCGCYGRGCDIVICGCACRCVVIGRSRGGDDHFIYLGHVKELSEINKR